MSYGSSKRPSKAARQRKIEQMGTWAIVGLSILGLGSCVLYNRNDKPAATQNAPTVAQPTPLATSAQPTTRSTAASVAPVPASSKTPKTTVAPESPVAPASTAFAVDLPWPDSIKPVEPSASKFEHKFTYSPSDANVRSVHLVGSMNGWSRDANPMRLNGNQWEITLPLIEGVYQYKFVVNGDQWRTDPNGDKSLEVDDNYGGKNSGVLVGPDARKLPAPAANAINTDVISHLPTDLADADAVTPNRLRIGLRLQSDDVESANVLFQMKGDPTWRSQPLAKQTTKLGFDRYGAILDLQGRPVRYIFELRDGSAVQYFAGGKAAATKEAAAQNADYNAVTPRFVTPEWTHNAVWYQIFPERFRNGDPSNDPPNTKPWTSDWWATLPGEAPGKENFYQGKGNVWNRRYGGDLKGLIDSLPYLRELGINAIYLNPIFEAESMHKYDTADYRHVDQFFGVKGDIEKLVGETDDPATWQWTETDKLFLKFVDEAHKQGFKVVLDGVFNHVGRKHPFFQDVLKNGKKSKYADWFDIRDWTPPIKYMAWDKGEPTNEGALPNFKKSATTGLVDGPRKHVHDITRRWLAPNGDVSKGIDGWRLDVANDIPHPFWIEWRKLVKGINPDAYICGEIWTWAQAWLQGDQFDAVMNYRFMETAIQFFADQNKAISVSQFNNQCFDIVNNYALQVALAQMNLFDSHDTDRFASMFVNPDLPFDGANRLQDNGPNYKADKPNDLQWQKMKLAVVWQMTFLGAPMIYYGDECGMWSPDDPSNRQPMIWRDLEPYDDARVSFKKDLFEHYQRAIATRLKFPALRTGAFRSVLIDDANGLYAYARDLKGETVYVVLNRSDREQTIELPVNSKNALINWMNPDQAELGKSDDGRPALKAIGGGTSPIDGKLSIGVGAYGSAVLGRK